MRSCRRAQFVCYLADDHLWFPDHLALMGRLLQSADLVHSMTIAVSTDGAVSTGMFDALADPVALERMEHARGGFGLSSGAHMMQAYRRLPGAGVRPARLRRGGYRDALLVLQCHKTPEPASFLGPRAVAGGHRESRKRKYHNDFVIFRDTVVLGAAELDSRRGCGVTRISPNASAAHQRRRDRRRVGPSVQ